MIPKLINVSNDNLPIYRMFSYRNVYHGDRLQLMKHLPLARMLIKKYSLRPYKHSPDHPDYLFLEYQVCTMLSWPANSPAQRTFLLSDLSWLLETNPVKLMSDPELPFDPRDLARFP